MENLLAFLWGFAEATLFFIIPDVWLTIVALQGAGAGLAAAAYAVLGALLGGTLMYYWGRANIERVSAILHRIPLIPPEDIQKVQADLQEKGIGAMFLGPLAGIPYKIYASYAHRVTNIRSFLLVSIPARGIRFVITVVAVPFFRDLFFSAASPGAQVRFLIVMWMAIYTGYFFQKRRR